MFAIKLMFSHLFSFQSAHSVCCHISLAKYPDKKSAFEYLGKTCHTVFERYRGVEAEQG